MKSKKQIRKASAVGHAIAVGLLGVLLAIPAGFFSQTVIKRLPSLFVSVGVLLLVVVIGIVFDVIGVAVTAAQESPLHARASRGVFGAREAARMVQHAHKVASFCNDVVGDVCGTISGAISIAIVFQIFRGMSPMQAVLWTSVMTALAAGLTVGGKAYGKVIAIEKSTEVVFQAGRCLAVWHRGLNVLRHRAR